METIKFQKSMYISFCSLSAAILLTACGGGGGDSGASSSTDNNDSGVPTAAISITNENSAQVVDASVDSMDTDEGATVFLAVNGPSANNQENRRSFKNLVDQIMSVKQNMPSSSSVMAAMQTDACENGGTFTYPADNETSGTLTANNCAYDGFVLNGSISFNGQEDNFGYNGSYSFRFNSFSITGLGLGDVVMNGDLNVSWQTSDNVETGSISSASLYIKTSADTIIMSNMNISYIDGVQYSEDISFTLNSTLLKGSVQVRSTQRLQYYNSYSDYPYAGEIVITGANNAKIRIIPQGDRYYSSTVSLEKDLDGDGTYEVSEVSTWDAIDL